MLEETGRAIQTLGDAGESARTSQDWYDPRMKLPRFRKLLCGLAVVAVLGASLLSVWARTEVPQSCTAIMGVSGDSVFAAYNKDHNDPIARIWFLPASESKYGRFVAGTSGLASGGMNEHGLVVDQLAMPGVDVPRDPAKPLYSGSWPVHVLETCRTVEEALASFSAYSFPGTWQTKVFLADATGDAAIIEGDMILRKLGHFLVTTNFLQSTTPTEGIGCSRFRTATRMLEDAAEYDAVLFRDIADTVHQEYSGGGGTVYSLVYDLRARKITCYLYYDFRHSVTFDLTAELAKGEHTADLADLLPGNARYIRWRAEKLEALSRRGPGHPPAAAERKSAQKGKRP